MNFMSNNNLNVSNESVNNVKGTNYTRDNVNNVNFTRDDANCMLSVRPGEPGTGAIRAPRGAEHVKEKVLSSAVAGEFVNMYDMLQCSITQTERDDELRTVIDDDGVLGLRPVKPKRSVKTSFQWLEAWGIYELIMVSAHGTQIFSEMALYRNFVISLMAKHKFPFVLHYDTRHRQLLGADRCINFTSMTPQLFMTTFDSNSFKNSSKCTRCGSTDHLENSCPFRVSGQAGDLPRSSKKQNSRQGGRQASDSAAPHPRTCYQFQDGFCKAGDRCSRPHSCMVCGGPEGYYKCKKCQPKMGSGAGPKS